MYCTYCGRPSAAESRFCEGCGKPLTGFAQPPTPQLTLADTAGAGAPAVTKQMPPATAQPVVAPGAPRPQPAAVAQVPAPCSPRTAQSPRGPALRRWIRRVAALGAIAVFVGFLKPWIVVASTPAWGSPGSSLLEASGYALASGSAGAIRGAESPALSNTVWLWVIPALGLLGLLAFNGRGSGAFAASAVGALGMVAMTGASLQILFANRDLASTGMNVQLGQGYWIAWLGFTWSLIVPMIASERKDEKPR